jgi:hypothetical protein
LINLPLISIENQIATLPVNEIVELAAIRINRFDNGNKNIKIEMITINF